MRTRGATTACFAAVIAAIGCGSGGDNERVDAANSADAWMPQGTAKSHTLFLQTEGVMLGPGPTDATTNTTPLVTTSHVMAAWRANDSDRATAIATLAADVRNLLAGYDVMVVTTRPASAPYDMVVVTDTSSNDIGLGFGVMSIFYNDLPCGTVPNSVGAILAGPPSASYSEKQAHIDSAAATAIFGAVNGVPLSTVPGDCMCFAATQCGSFKYDTACTIGGPNTAVDPNGSCGAGATMDENAVFLSLFGPR